MFVNLFFYTVKSKSVALNPILFYVLHLQYMIQMGDGAMEGQVYIVVINNTFRRSG